MTVVYVQIYSDKNIELRTFSSWIFLCWSWTFMNFHGQAICCSWTFMNINEQTNFVDHEPSWTFMDRPYAVHGHPWTFMNRPISLSMNVHERSWIKFMARIMNIYELYIHERSWTFRVAICCSCTFMNVHELHHELSWMFMLFCLWTFMNYSWTFMNNSWSFQQGRVRFGSCLCNLLF